MNLIFKIFFRVTKNIYGIIFTGAILILVVGFIDYYTTSEISFSIFYLLPISFVTWYANKSLGITFAVLSAVIWLYMDMISPNTYSFEAIPYWNALVRFGFFIITVLLINKVKLLKVNLEESVSQRTAALLSEIEHHKNTKAEIIQINNNLRDLNKKMETIKEEQNTRIAREIHDELGQSLTGINLELQWISKKYSNNADIVNRMHMLSEIVTETIGTVRKISSDLRPRLLDQLGIFSAIESQLKDFEKRTGINYRYSFPEKNIDIDNLKSTTIFRIFQESLTNISRHAKCTKVEVDISCEKNLLLMEISDNGIGFDSQSTNGNGHPGTLGILGMKERAKILNSTLDINSAPGNGTKIILSTPI